jgi:hypothetical protein
LGEGIAMALGTEGETQAEKGESPSSAPARKPSLLARFSARFGSVDDRTLVYVLLIIAGCALAIVAIAAVTGTMLSSPSAVSSLHGGR